MSTHECVQLRLNHEHATNPQVKDIWHERFAVIGRVVACTRDLIIFQYHRRHTEHGKPLRGYTRRGFTQLFRYKTIDGFWADCVPRPDEDAHDED